MLTNASGIFCKPFDRQGIEHFIGDDDAPVRSRQIVEPVHALRESWHCLPDQRSLALAQVRRHFEYRVAIGQGIEFV